MKVLIVCLLFAYLAQAKWVKEMENENPTSFGEEGADTQKFYEGDIYITKGEYEEVASGSHVYGSEQGTRWPNPLKIPYTIHSSLRNNRYARSALAAAIADYKKKLCLELVPKTTESNYIEFGDFGRGCSSPVGFRPWRKVNGISLVRGCWHKGTIMHEIGHSLGLWHEQSRPDRDQHVEIQFHKIKPANVHNFKMMKGIDALGTRYDYLSMMHYGRSAFSKVRGDITIKTKDPNMQYKIGQRNGLSEIDMKELNLMYPALQAKCGAVKPTSDPNCKDIDSRCKNYPTARCKSPASWKNWMGKYCRKYCGLC